MSAIYIVFEDQLSEFVMRTLIDFCEIDHGSIVPMGNRGYGYIKTRIDSFNKLNDNMLFFVLTDLDDGNCAPELIRDWLPNSIRKNLIFRVAVREVEAWLLADYEGFAKFVNLNKDFVEKETRNVEGITNPKEALIKLVARSKLKNIREDIVGENMTQGPAYNSRLRIFIDNQWSIERAVTRSDSLQRTIAHLAHWKS